MNYYNGEENTASTMCNPCPYDGDCEKCKEDMAKDKHLKEESKKDIQSKIAELHQERQGLSVEYIEKVKKIDAELVELNYRLMSGKY